MLTYRHAWSSYFFIEVSDFLAGCLLLYNTRVNIDRAEYRVGESQFEQEGAIASKEPF